MYDARSMLSDGAKTSLSSLIQNPNPRSVPSSYSQRSRRGIVKKKRTKTKVHVVPIIFIILLIAGLLSIAHFHVSLRRFGSISANKSASNSKMNTLHEENPLIIRRQSAPANIKDKIQSVHDGYEHILERDAIEGLNLNSHKGADVGLAAAGKVMVKGTTTYNLDNSHTDTSRIAVAAPKNQVLKKNVFPDAKGTIAYAISITSCNGEGASRLIDGAAVLKHSIHLNSIDSHKKNNNGSQFSYQMIAFLHPDASDCEPHLRQLGYHVMKKDTPIKVEDIKKEWYREHVVKSGCCQEKEFLKLYAYTLLDFSVVVHLDVDSLILKPLDDLFLVMMNSDGGIDATESPIKTQNTYDGANLKNVPVMLNKPLTETVNAFFTRDYNMIRPGKEHVGVQGGFLIVRPSLAVFEEYKNIILDGNFDPGRGWGGKYGGYYGAQQIQGIASYFYDHFHPNTAVELNRCIYNSMADNPRNPKKDGSKCRDGKDFCEDCRGTSLENIRSIHFTLCQKPWLCHQTPESGENTVGHHQCNLFHKEWHKVRSSLEDFLQVNSRNRAGEYNKDAFFGHCNFAGKRGYIPLFEIGHGINEETTE